MMMVTTVVQSPGAPPLTNGKPQASPDWLKPPAATQPQPNGHAHPSPQLSPIPSQQQQHQHQQYYPPSPQPSPQPLPQLQQTTFRRRTSLQTARRTVSLDDVPEDEDAHRWTEHIKAKRVSKRHGRQDTEEEDRVLVGTKVSEGHVNFVTAYNMLTGIRFTVSRTNAKLDRELSDVDFTAKHKFSFDITGNELTPSAKYDFKFKDYAPWVFRHLRNKFGIDPAEYLMSLTSKYILSELGSPGKSGSFFYFSRDYKYIIKTIHHGEHKFLRKILRQYYDHVEQNPNTLLSQFYGLHRVKMPYGRKIHFVVMNNLFPPHRDIHSTFDLKGSTIGRDYDESKLESNPRATMKDLNWLRRNKNLEFGPQKKGIFIHQMEKDVALLQKLKIMDYSMLVGIHDMDRGNDDNLRDKHLQVFQPGADRNDGDERPGGLARTPSKLEHARRVRELRESVKKERPVPMEAATDVMPDEANRTGFFYKDDGGFRASNEDNTAGGTIYYLGIIDCLTRYNIVKKAEHLWKGFGGHEPEISPIPPQRYGERFIRFISSTTKPSNSEPPMAEKEKISMDHALQHQQQQQRQLSQSPTNMSSSGAMLSSSPTSDLPAISETPSLPR